MPIKLKYYRATLFQLVVPLLMLWLLRFPFAFENAEALGSPSVGRIFVLACHGLKFDLCAWAWFNSVFILMRFLPFRLVAGRKYLLVTDIIYVVSNLLMLLPAIADIPFFRFNGTRLRRQALEGILGDPSMGGIILSFVSDYAAWFLVALIPMTVLGVVAFCVRPVKSESAVRGKVREYWIRSGVFLFVAGLTFLCMRGHLGAGRPLSVADAVWHIEDSREANVVLNTPFCIIRSLNGNPGVEQLRFFSDAELKAIRDSRRRGSPVSEEKKRNIMVIALESGSPVWIDRINPVPDESVEGYMPFMDSIASVSLVFPNTFATGVRSIEGITAVFGGIPTFNEMILLSSPYYANAFDAPASLLRREGWSSRFYFGGNHGSFNIDQTLKAFGFDEVVTRQEYGDDRDFDGYWGVWDDRMGEYAARDLSSLREPFIAGWFTLNPHAPFEVPAERPWKYRASDDLRRTVEYEDRALRHFFETARGEPWFEHTVFVFVGDHGCRDLQGTVYDTPGILPHITMMIYAPDGSVASGVDDRVAAQYDVAPTLVALAGYAQDYISLGQSMLDADRQQYALMYLKGAYRVFGPRYAVSMSPDFRRVEGIYDRLSDPGMTRSLTRYDEEEVKVMADWARAFMQDYSTRLNTNTLSTRQ